MGDNKLRITPKPPKGEDGYKLFSIRVKEEMVARIETLTVATGRSRNELISLLLEYALDHCEIEEV